MATSTQDQVHVSKLAERFPGKIVPAFGYHPWFVHKISLDEGICDPKDHYDRLFSEAPNQDEVRVLSRELPNPDRLHDLLQTLEANLCRHPQALLGEIGLDRVFRLPRDPKGYTREPEEVSESNEKMETLSLGRRDRPLTSLSPPIEHQIFIARAQIEIAIRLKRSVSFHCVRAGGALVALLEDIRKTYPSRGDNLSKRQRKQRKKDAEHSGLSCEDSVDDEKVEAGSQMMFDNINLDLHSCTLSPQTISQIQKKHPNVYVSFSIAINSRQKNLADQIKACDPRRLLIESDWHSAEDLGARCWTMLRVIVDTLGLALEPMLQTPNGQSKNANEKYLAAAQFFHDNWTRFQVASSTG